MSSSSRTPPPLPKGGSSSSTITTTTTVDSNTVSLSASTNSLIRQEELQEELSRQVRISKGNNYCFMSLERFKDLKNDLKDDKMKAVLNRALDAIQQNKNYFSRIDDVSMVHVQEGRLGIKCNNSLWNQLSPVSYSETSEEQSVRDTSSTAEVMSVITTTTTRTGAPKVDIDVPKIIMEPKPGLLTASEPNDVCILNSENKKHAAKFMSFASFKRLCESFDNIEDRVSKPISDALFAMGTQQEFVYNAAGLSITVSNQKLSLMCNDNLWNRIFQETKPQQDINPTQNLPRPR